MSRILLVRHGESEWHAGNRYAGRSDIGLTEKGYEQAEALAEWACSADLAAVWTSPLRRARLTAEPAARTTGLPLQLDDRLLELDFGRGEGLTAADMRLDFPAQRAAFELDPVRHPLPGGEDPAAATARGVAALQAIASQQTHGRSLVVAHSTLLRLVLCHLLGIPLSRYRTVFPRFANGAVTELELQPDTAALLTLNLPLGT